MAREVISAEILTQDTLKKLAQVERLTKDKSVPLRRAAFFMMGETGRRFRQERSPDGGKWLDLAQSTKDRRRKGRGAGRHRILQDTGLLRDSVSILGKAGNVYYMDNDSVSFGTNLNYAGAHQFGVDKTVTVNRTGVTWLKTNKSGRLKRQKEHPNLAVFAKRTAKHKKGVPWNATYQMHIRIPARPFLGFSPKDVKMVNRIFNDWADMILAQNRTVGGG